ncbi:MAG: hypothetical protein AB7P33_16730 [Dehalococcoidia bacterium]
MIQLDDRESELLLQVLRNTLSDLRMTISDTENYDWRQEMKKDEELMKSLIARLESALGSRIS